MGEEGHGCEVVGRGMGMKWWEGHGCEVGEEGHGYEVVGGAWV